MQPTDRKAGQRSSTGSMQATHPSGTAARFGLRPTARRGPLWNLRGARRPRVAGAPRGAGPEKRRPPAGAVQSRRSMHVTRQAAWRGKGLCTPTLVGLPLASLRIMPWPSMPHELQRAGARAQTGTMRVRRRGHGGIRVPVAAAQPRQPPLAPAGHGMTAGRPCSPGGRSVLRGGRRGTFQVSRWWLLLDSAEAVGGPALLGVQRKAGVCWRQHEAAAAAALPHPACAQSHARAKQGPQSNNLGCVMQPACTARTLGAGAAGRRHA